MKNNNQRAKRVWISFSTIFILCFFLSGCTGLFSQIDLNSKYPEYLNAIDAYNRNIAEHEVVNISLNPDGTVGSIIFKGNPKFAIPREKENAILKGMKILLPTAERLLAPGADVATSVIKAGGDIVYSSDSNNNTSSGTDSYIDHSIPSSDSHDTSTIDNHSNINIPSEENN